MFKAIFSFLILISLYSIPASAAVLCSQNDYVCAGHFQLEQNLNNRLQYNFPEVPLACYNMTIRRSTGLCKNCADFENFSRGIEASCSDVVERINQAAYGWEVPQPIRCSYNVKIRLKRACVPGFRQLYGTFPLVRLELNGTWVPVQID